MDKVISFRYSQILKRVLSDYRFEFTDEAELQEAIARVLQLEGINYLREVELNPGDRIDFMIERTGVEVKIGFSISEVIRQLHRYAQSDAVDELVLITSRVKHDMPESMNYKPLTKIDIGLVTSL